VRATALADGGVPHDLRQLEGEPATVLVDASRGAEMVVVGPCGHGALVGLVLGSVTDHLTRHAACPVVVVRGAAA
jgi:nucleotide-binding universal stress UspA family protein